MPPRTTALGGVFLLLAAGYARAAPLALKGEARLRWNDFGNEQLVRGSRYRQTWLRLVLGADLRVTPGFRVFAEAGRGQVYPRSASAVASLGNEASLQQLFVELSHPFGPDRVAGVIGGRQEFSDGPRQLISVSDGPNLHLTWNGARLYANGSGARLGAFAFRATRQEPGSFDERIRREEKLQGASVGVGNLDGYWFATENPQFRSGGRTGLDDRDTFAVRFRSRSPRAGLETTLAGQTGRYRGRRIRAWGFFAAQTYLIKEDGWKPRFGTRVDIASGGGAYGNGTLKAFNQLYAGSNYLGQGRFFSTSNLIMLTPGLSASPTEKTGVLLEYSVAQRYTEHDAAYAGGMKAYSGTQNVSGRGIGTQLRLEARWSAARYLEFMSGYERLYPGVVLRRAGFPPGDYGYCSMTFRY